MVLDHENDYPSRWTAVTSIAARIGCSGHTLLEWVKKAEVYCGKRAGVPTGLADRLKALERENRELRQANEILAQGFRIFCPGGARPPVQAMTSFIDEHRGEYGVEPICRVLPIAPSTYHEHGAQRPDLSRLSARAQCDEAMKPEVRRVFDANLKVYGVRKVWRQMQREGFDIARGTVERLEKLVRGRNTAQKVVWRARIVMLAGEGRRAGEIAHRVGKSVLTMRRWRRCYATKGVDGLLKDATRLTRRWSSRLTRRAKSRRLTAPSPDYR